MMQIHFYFFFIFLYSTFSIDFYFTDCLPSRIYIGRQSMKQKATLHFSEQRKLHYCYIK